MEIKNLNQENSLGTVQTRKAKSNPYQEQQKADVAKNKGEGLDTVQLSSLSKQLSQVSNILKDDSIEQANKVQAIKERVENGTYEVNSSDVARSLVSFSLDNERGI